MIVQEKIMCCTLVNFFLKGVSAILSPNTGIVDWAEVARSYGEDFKKAGGEIYTGYEVRRYSCLYLLFIASYF